MAGALIAVNPYYIAAIDFGTSNCSLAYSVDRGETIEKFYPSESHDRVPTAVLLDSVDKQSCPAHSIPMSVVDIGKVAQQSYGNLREEDYCKYLYFECFKMNLRPHNEVITRQMQVSAFKGANYYIIEVIAFVLKHLKSKFEEELEMSDIQDEGQTRILKASDFTWVITVPAIWDDKGKQMMREAAYTAGLLADTVTPINSFTSVTQPLTRCDMNEYYHKLVLALEPECAALYCQQLTKNKVAAHCRPRPVDCSTSNHYMVLDIGGGTVDVAVYNRKSEDISDSVLPPTGNDWGGTKVNEEYSKLLQVIVDDPQFTRFCEKRQCEAHHKAVITMHIFHDFETAKRTFGSNTKQERSISLRLNRKIVDFYGADKIREGVEALNDKRIELNGSDLLIIHSPKVEELFSPVVTGIFDCVNSAIAKCPIEIDAIYLVGGFGGCSYIYNKIRECPAFSKLRVITPRDHQLAVVKGAVLFQRNPSTMNSRICSAYYGFEATVKYDPHQKHERPRRRYDYKREKFVTDNVFEIVIRKNQKVKYDKALEFPSYATPLSETSSKVELKLFKTYIDGIVYTRDANGKLYPGVEEIGKLELATPPSDLPLAKRTISLTIYIGGPEFSYEVTNDETGEKVIGTVDFLS